MAHFFDLAMHNRASDFAKLIAAGFLQIHRFLDHAPLRYTLAQYLRVLRGRHRRYRHQVFQLRDIAVVVFHGEFNGRFSWSMDEQEDEGGNCSDYEPLLVTTYMPFIFT